MNDHPSTPGGQGDPYGAQDPYGSQQPTYGQHHGDPTSPYGQSPYGQPGQPAYGQQPYPQQPGQPWPGAPVPPAPPVPSSATTSMVLGIIALASLVVACGIGLVLSPFAWVIGGRAVKEIDASHGALGGRDQAQAGRVMGIIGTVALVMVVVIALAFIALVVAGGLATSEFTSTSTDF